LSLGQVGPDLILDDLGVVDVDVGLLGLEVTDEGDGSRLASVTRVGLECEAKDGDALK
jgi:hypothetical protein